MTLTDSPQRYEQAEGDDDGHYRRTQQPPAKAGGLKIGGLNRRLKEKAAESRWFGLRAKRAMIIVSATAAGKILGYLDENPSKL